MKGNQDILSRKHFLKTTGSTALFAALGISFHGCSSVTDSNSEIPDPDPSDPESAVTANGDTITINLNHGDAAHLRDEGGWMLIRTADSLVANVNGETLRAFTSVCTHVGCNTSWQFTDSQFVCQCHGSRFNTNGEVTQGPANRDLEEFETVRDDDIVTITK